MEGRFILTIPVQYVPDNLRQKRCRKALMDMVPWIQKVDFLQERGQPVVKVGCKGEGVDQSKALSMIRTELQQQMVAFVHKSSDVGEYKLEPGKGVTEEL